MRLTLIHDLNGNITKAIATAPQGPTVTINPGPGERSVEMAVPSEYDLTDTTAIGDYVDYLIANYRVVGFDGDAPALERR